MNGRGRWVRWGALAVWAVAFSLPARARPRAKVAWIRATTWSGSRRAPARMWPGHLLDGDRRTVACFDTGTLPVTFTLGLTGPARADEIWVVNGDGRSRAAFGRSARVATLTLIESSYVREVHLADAEKQQAVRLDPPLRDESVTVRIDAIHGEGRKVCLSDLRLVRRGRPLGIAGGSAPRWRGLASRLQGLWIAGPPGAAEKFLSLGFDGHYRFAYRPNDPDLRGSTRRGRWALHGKVLHLEGSGPPLRLRVRLRREEDDAGEIHPILELRGKGRGWRALVPDRYRLP